MAGAEKIQEMGVLNLNFSKGIFLYLLFRENISVVVVVYAKSKQQ